MMMYKLLYLQQRKDVFVAEAMLQFYLGLLKTVCETLNNGSIGKPIIFEVSLGIAMYELKRKHSSMSVYNKENPHSGGLSRYILINCTLKKELGFLAGALHSF